MVHCGQIRTGVFDEDCFAIVGRVVESAEAGAGGSCFGSGVSSVFSRALERERMVSKMWVDFERFEPSISACRWCLTVIAEARVQELGFNVEQIRQHVINSEWLGCNAVLELATRRTLEVYDLCSVLSVQDGVVVEEIDLFAGRMAKLMEGTDQILQSFWKTRTFIDSCGEEKDVYVCDEDMLAFRRHVQKQAEADSSLSAAWVMLDCLEEAEDRPMDHDPYKLVVGSLIYRAAAAIDEIGGADEIDDLSLVRNAYGRVVSRASHYLDDEDMSNAEFLNWVK